MKSSEVGSKDWWLVVQSMPFEEALIHLNDYRASLMIYNAGHPQYISAMAQITKINSEVKRLNQILDNSRWSRACKNVLDAETFEEVMVEKRRLEEEAKRQF